MSKFFIRRPIVAMVISLLHGDRGRGHHCGTAGSAVSRRSLRRKYRFQPMYTGADAQTIEQSVATPIEQQMSGVDNMNYMYSLNATAKGEMRMIVDFDVKTDPNTDLILAQSRDTHAASQLPPEVNSYGVTVQKILTAPLMLLSLNSPNSTWTRSFWPITPTSISTISSRECRASAVFRFLAPVNMRCGCGSSPINWPSSASPCPRSSRASRLKTR